MNSFNNLVTSYSFRGKEYLVNLHSVKNIPACIEIKVTDKKTQEEWQGSYDASYIESLTQKTGNYKRFDTFVSMLKSGFLRTSQCVTMDLLTFEDLEMLRSRKSYISKTYAATGPNSSQILGSSPSCNRRYLIVTYTVEFDRIHYPLAMEYCGPPDPRVLQETIERLEKQVLDLQNQLNGSSWGDITHQIDSLQKKVVEVTNENIFLKEQLNKVVGVQKSKYSGNETDMLLRSVHNLESRLVVEAQNVKLLKKENSRLTLQLEQVIKQEKSLRAQLDALNFEPHVRNRSKEQKFQRNFSSLSPSKNRSLENVNLASKPFCRSRDRRISSARSALDIARSSSEDSMVCERGGVKRQLKQGLQNKRGLVLNLSPRSRVLSPTFSDVSHISGISRCACRSCLRSKYVPGRQEDISGNDKNQDKGISKAKLLKRIQSLEKLISLA